MPEPNTPREEDDGPGGELVPFPAVPPVPAADTSYEIALDDGPTGPVEPVHSGDGIALPARPGTIGRRSPGRAGSAIPSPECTGSTGPVGPSSSAIS